MAAFGALPMGSFFTNGMSAVDQLKPFPGLRANGRFCQNLPFTFH